MMIHDSFNSRQCNTNYNPWFMFFRLFKISYYRTKIIGTFSNQKYSTMEMWLMSEWNWNFVKYDCRCIL